MGGGELHAHFLKEIDRWFANNGDQTHRLDYPLNSDSVVVDLGGYEGKWASNIRDRYGSFVYVFEPVPAYCENIRRLFTSFDKVRVFEYALGNEDCDAVINMSADGSSMFVDSDEHVTIKVKSVHDFIKGLHHIDLIKINIEGAEYDLLDCLTDEEILKIDNIQVQFHTFYPECQERRNAIRNRLSKTHQLTYNYDFVWENWKRK